MFSRLKRSVSKRWAQASLPPIARQVMDERLTYLSAMRMASLLKEIRRVNRRCVAGDFVEFGMALGGSAIVIASNKQDRRFSGYDLFGQIPSPGPRDNDDAHSRYEIIAAGKSTGLGGQPYYGYEPDLYSKVVGTFARYGLDVDQDNIAFHKGLFEETFPSSKESRIALAHIDCDWYDPVYFCMKHISPMLTPGGAILIDDFNDYAGCHDAVTTALKEDNSIFFERTTPHAVIRKL
jgi:O-methyltransferase